MVIVWIIFIALAALAMAAMLWPLRRSSTSALAEHPAPERSPDAQLYHDQLKELDRDQARGLIDEREKQTAKTEIARRLLAVDKAPARPAPAPLDKKSVIGILLAAGAVPLIALGLYLAWGSPHLPGAPYGGGQARLEDSPLNALVAKVEESLRETPADAQGWAVIAPVYMSLGRFNEAVHAYQRVIALEGETAGILSRLGEAMVYRESGLVTAQARKTFERIRSINPDNPVARYYLAIAAVQEGNVDAGFERMAALYDELEPGDPLKITITRAMAAFKDRSGLVNLFEKTQQDLNEVEPLP